MNIPEEDAEFDPFENDPKNKKKRASGSGAVAWLALLLAMAVTGFNAWDWWLERNQPETDSGLETQLSSLQRLQAGIESRLEGVSGEVETLRARDVSADLQQIRNDQQSLQSRISELGMSGASSQGQFDALNTSLLAMQRRIDSLEVSIAALAVRGDRAGSSLDIAEVDYLLRLAAERLAMFADPDSADRALALADRHLADLEDPLYVPVRRRIQESRQALAAVPRLDTVAITSTISGLQSRVPGLPFPGELPSPETVQTDEEQGIWARVKSALAPLVTVRRRVDEAELLSLEDKDFLRQALWLQLESARLAMARSDQGGWDVSVSRARTTLADHFETIDVGVREVADELSKLGEISLSNDYPDISAAAAQLKLLRQGSVVPAALPLPEAPLEQETDSVDEATDEELPVEDTDDPDGAGR